MFRVVKTLDDLISRDPSIKGELGPTAADVLEGFDRKQLDRTKKTITVMDALINSPEMSPEKLKEQRQELEQRDPGAMQRLMQEGQALANGSEDLSLEHPLVQSALRGGDIETKLKVWCWVTIRADKDFDQAFVENTNKVLGGEQAAGETIKQRGQEVKEVETKNRENLRGIIDVLKNKWFQITAVVVGVLALGFYGGWKTRKWFGRLGGDHGRRTTADLADDLRRSQRGPDGGDGDGGRRGTPPETPKDGGGDRGGGPPKKAPPEGKGGGDAASRPGPDTGRTRTVIVPTPGVPTTVQVPDTTSPPLKEPPKGSEATTRRPRGTPAAPAATSAASTNPGSGQRMNRRQALGKMMDPAAKIRERDQARGAATGSGERSISPYERAGRAYSDPAGRAALDRARATAPGTPPGEAKRANERVEAEHRQAGAGAPVDQRGKPKISQPPHVPRGAKGG
jgi:hypothetical protein